MEQADRRQLGYSQKLRALGQALEGMDLREFVVEVEGDAYVVRGQANHPAPQEQLV